MKNIIVYSLGMIIILSIGCKKVNQEGDRKIIEKIIHDCTGWAINKDFNRLEEILSHDDLFFFYINSDDIINNYEEFRKGFDYWKDPRFKATHYNLRDLRIVFSHSGDVAWYSAILDDCMEWDNKPFCVNNTRWTGVLEKRDGKWVIVQMHYSLAKDQVLQEEKNK